MEDENPIDGEAQTDLAERAAPPLDYRGANIPKPRDPLLWGKPFLMCACVVGAMHLVGSLVLAMSRMDNEVSPPSRRETVATAMLSFPVMTAHHDWYHDNPPAWLANAMVVGIAAGAGRVLLGRITRT